MNEFQVQHAEAMVVGGASQDPIACQSVDLSAAEFSHPAARRLWGSMLELSGGDGWRNPDDLAVQTARAETELGLLREYLGDAGIVAAPRDVPAYAKQVRHHATTRAVLELGETVRRRVEAGVGGEELVTEVMTQLAGHRDQLQRTRSRLASEIVGDLLDAVSHADDPTYEGTTRYVPIGLPRLEQAMGGWQGGVVSVVGARTSMGKSAFLLQSAMNAARLGIPVHVLSAEDLELDTGWRLVSHATGRTVSALRRYRKLDELERRRVITTAAGAGEMARVRISPATGLSARQIVATVRLYQRTDNTGIVMFDYLQRLPAERGRKRYETLTEAMGLFDDAAKEDGLPWVIASQLKRSDEKYPRLGDFREAGTIEEIAKTALGLYRPRQGQPNDDRMWIGVLKASNSATSEGWFRWDGGRVRILDEEPT